MRNFKGLVKNSRNPKKIDPKVREGLVRLGMLKDKNVPTLTIFADLSKFR